MREKQIIAAERLEEICRAYRAGNLIDEDYPIAFHEVMDLLEVFRKDDD